MLYDILSVYVLNLFWIFIINNIILIVFVALIIGYGFYIRNKLFTIWQQVSRLEITFHAKLFETVKLYQEQSHILEQCLSFKFIESFKTADSKRLRHHTLSDRQKLFKAMQKMYGEIYQNEELNYEPLKRQFESLQQCRLKYNSKVILYNQKIHTFPTKIFAKRMRFLPKDYFG